jgi:hypothetical protein
MSMEKKAEREQRNANDCAEQVKVMAHAIPLPPTHPRENLKGFADMREGHYDHACSSQQLEH